MRGIIVLVIVLVVALAALGFYRGWFSLSTADDLRRDEFNVDLKVDKGKMHADVESARSSARGLAENAKKAVKDGTKTETVQGVVTEISRDQLTVKRADDTEVTIVRKAVESEARAGDHVSVACVTEEGRRVARSITVERP